MLTIFRRIDQVVNYEVVLADGSIVEANDTMNPDLFRVLKGGHNNFGIVTRFDMKIFAAKNVWDGSIVHSKAVTNEVIEAYVDFQTKLVDSPDSHVLAMWVYMPQTPEYFINVVVTSLDGVENTKPFQKLLTVPGQQNITSKTIASKVAEFLVPSGRL